MPRQSRIRSASAGGPLEASVDLVGGARRSTSTERVYATLRSMVIESELAPGSQILEQDLSDRLEVSRTPLREALIRLQNEGLVEIIPRHGVRIVPMSISDMREIYQVLISLESTAAAALAASQPTPEALAELEAICDRMTAFLEAGDITAWAKEDERFHLAFVRLVGNRRMREIVANCWDQVHRARMFTLRLQTHPQPAISIREHSEIIAALRDCDAERARALMHSHRQRGGDRQIGIIEAYRILHL